MRPTDMDRRWFVLLAVVLVGGLVGFELVVGFGTHQHDGTVTAELSLSATYDAEADVVTIAHEGGRPLTGAVPVWFVVSHPDGRTTSVPLLGTDAGASEPFADPPIEVADTVTVPASAVFSGTESPRYADGMELTLRFDLDGGTETYRLGTVDGEQVVE